MRHNRIGFSGRFWHPPILAYHRVRPEPGSDSPTISPEIFEKQMAILRKKWKPIPLVELVQRLEKKQPWDRRVVVVTFDDGTEDNFTHAFPILMRYQIPATIFVIVDDIGKSGQLKSAQMQEMAAGGISFGSHTLHHAYLPSVSIDYARREIFESKKKLESFGFSSETISYPAGGFSETVIQEVQKAGYVGACTTNRGFRQFPVDRWALRRVTMHANATTSFGMWLRCCGYYGFNRRLRAPS